MKLLLDTNVLLDYVTKRNGNHIAVGKIVDSCVKNQNIGYVTSHSITDLFYITRKYIPDPDRREWTRFVVKTFTILTENDKAFMNSLNAEHFDDLEDQLQMETASAAELDYIITENLKDFSFSDVPAVSSMDFAARMV